MNEENLIVQLAGGNSVVDWFGRVPNFHDATIIGINLIQGEVSSLSLHAWNTTDTVDKAGFFVTEKHATVKIEFATIELIELADFDFDHVGVVSSLEFVGSEAATEVRWTSSVGVDGRIKGSGVTLSVSPHKATNS